MIYLESVFFLHRGVPEPLVFPSPLLQDNRMADCSSLTRNVGVGKVGSHVIPHHVQNNGKLIQSTMTSRFQRYCLWKMDFSLEERAICLPVWTMVKSYSGKLTFHDTLSEKNTCIVGRSQTVNLKIPSLWTFYSGVPAHESTSFILGQWWRRRIWEGRELPSK